MKAIVQTPLHELRQKETDAAVKDLNLQNTKKETETLKTRVELVESVVEEMIIGGMNQHVYSPDVPDGHVVVESIERR